MQETFLLFSARSPVDPGNRSGKLLSGSQRSKLNPFKDDSSYYFYLPAFIECSCRRKSISRLSLRTETISNNFEAIPQHFVTNREIVRGFSPQKIIRNDLKWFRDDFRNFATLWQIARAIFKRFSANLNVFFTIYSEYEATIKHSRKQFAAIFQRIL